MSYIQAIILGLVQGLTEFLPVSSSGHLAIVQYFFDIEGDSVVIFTVMLHAGTLVSVIFMYWRDLWDLFVELLMTIGDLVTGRGLRLADRPIRRLGVMLVIASIPTGIIGILFNDIFESMYSTLIPIGIGLIITGCMLWFSERKRMGYKDETTMSYSNALVIGLLQGLAICPGISRSGSTLVGGLSCKLDRDFAVRFAFLLSFPAILGSLIFEMSDEAMMSILMGNLGPVLVGGVVAAVSGVFAIKTMIRIVRKSSLRLFSIYVWIIGIFVIIITVL
ncbi:MAG: undecaprenyl-diphosphate phosphatase [Mogibacterium sp.]|nr:undecaprenyl-diphosphate phosphatase [Mogibacterium sp.]